MNTLQDLVQFFQTEDDFICVGHEHPDPDSLGSMLGLYFGLKKLGKSCRVVSGDPIPSHLDWPGMEVIEYIPEGFEPGDSCVVVLDCEPNRTGPIAPGVQRAACLVNIDHHERGRGPGRLVYVDPKEAATSIIVYRLLQELKVPFDHDIATLLYGGILGDTGGFRHANTNGEVFQIAADLLSYGVEPAPLARQIFSSQPFEFLKLLGHTLGQLEVAAEGKLVWAAVDYETFGKYAINPEETDHLIGYVRSLDTAEVAMVFREIKPGDIRLGLRANETDVGKLARYLGGGGHKLASGASLKGDFSEVVQRVVKIAKEYLATGVLDERDN